MVSIAQFQSIVVSSKLVITLIQSRLLSTKSCVTRSPNNNNNNMSSTSSSSSKAVLIFLHGLGDRGSSWQMQLSAMIPEYIKCICPTASVRAVTLNYGARMNSWFDLRSLDPSDPEDEDGINEACERIHQLIADQEKQGISHDRIMLGGFSQGGALSIYSALRYPKKLAGVVALSCWLPIHAKFPSLASEANKKIPILQCHGEDDFVVPLAWGQATQAVLSTFLDKENYEFKVYKNLGHTTKTTELNDVLSFIKKQLPAASS